MPAPGVVLETLRHLRFRQIRHQLRNRLAPPRDSAPLPLAWSGTGGGRGRSKNARRVLFDGRSRFDFNNEAREFAGDWNDAAARKLWLYNLHYMAWIFDLDSGREEWMRRWIRENPKRAGGNGWEPYPTSLRLFNWCKHFALADRGPEGDILASMGDQAACLLDRLEFHLDGNHLLENLLALCFVGFHLDSASPRGRAAMARIRRHLEAEIGAQFLRDGGHCELSPMYHSILLERMLDLLAFWPQGGDPFPGLAPKLAAAARAGLAWLDTMTVSGRFALFNDSAYDPAPDADLLLDYGARVLGFRPAEPAPLRALPDSGYYRAEAGPLTLIFDAGPLGPDHQLGHAQGDMLSFCLWAAGAPILVHPGSFEYVPGAMRDYCRSTASHNTLVIEGGEQAEWWAAHRVGRRGRPRDVSARRDALSGTLFLAGAHDGFRRLPGAPLHRRRLELSPGALEVVDEVEPAPGRPCRAYFHFHPDCTVTQEGDAIRVSSPAGGMTLASDRPLLLQEGWHCPEFGLRLRNRVAVAEFPGGACRTTLVLPGGKEGDSR